MFANKIVLIYRWFRPNITNAFFMTPRQSIFFKEIEQQTLNYSFDNKNRTSDEIMFSFGRGRYNKVLKKIIEIPKGKCLSENFAFINEHNALKLMPPYNLSYKLTTDAWQNNFIK